MRSATLPSMKSKMFAMTMTRPAVPKRPVPSAHPAPALMMTPVRVSRLGCTSRRTHRSMMARRGYMQSAPIMPVKVIVDEDSSAEGRTI